MIVVVKNRILVTINVIKGMEISFVCVECDYRSSNWEQINVYGFLCSFLPKEPSRNIRRKESTELK
jgi:hypothetical protein